MSAVANSAGLTFESDILDNHVSVLSEDRPVASFGLEPLNRLLGGVYPGQLYVIGATPGTGKTTLLLQLADELAAAGNPVIFVSAELPAHKLLAKSLARLSGGSLSLGNVASAARPESEDHQAFSSALSLYRDQVAPNICITEAQNVTELGHLVCDCLRRRGKPPVLFIDYLQLVATGCLDPYAEERLAISACLKGLRDISNCYGSPVFTVSTITRNYYGSKSPNLSIFGGAAVIEYCADSALYLAEDKDAAPSPFDPFPGRPVTLTALKNRYGTLDTARLAFNGEHATFLARE